jgi:hypothetical protein
MGRVITQVSMAILIAACSTGYPAMQQSPTVALAPSGHYGSVDGDRYFVVTLGRVPFILAADFVPG